MHRIKKAEKKDFKIDKNTKEIKNDCKSKSPKEKKTKFLKLSQKENNKTKKLKIAYRPHSNYLPKYKNNAKTSKIKINNLFAIGYSNNPLEFNNQKFNQKLFMIEKEINTNETIINKNSNEINLINELISEKMINEKEQKQKKIQYKKISEYYCTSPIKKNKSNSTEAKNTENKKIFNNQINRYLSPKNFTFKKNKKIIYTEKNTSNSCKSPSIANKSISNGNKSSKNIFFGNSFIVNTIKNKFVKHNKSNEKKIDGDMLIANNNGVNNSTKMTAIEYQLNKLLAKKKKQLKMKNVNLSTKHENFNIEEMYSNFAKKIEEESQKESINNYIYGNKKNDNNINKVNTSFNKAYTKINNNYYNDKNINGNLNYSNTSVNLFSKKDKDRKNNISNYNNPIIKYSFFNKIMNSLTRKVNFINPNRKKELELSIRVIDGKKCAKSQKNSNINYDFISYGYELTPQKIFRMKEKNYKDIIKAKENNMKQIIKKDKRPISSFFLSHNKSFINDKIHNPFIQNKIEKSQNLKKERKKLVIINRIKNYNNNSFDFFRNNSSDLSIKINNNTPDYKILKIHLEKHLIGI